MRRGSGRAHARTKSSQDAWGSLNEHDEGGGERENVQTTRMTKVISDPILAQSSTFHHENPPIRITRTVKGGVISTSSASISYRPADLSLANIPERDFESKPLQEDMLDANQQESIMDEYLQKSESQNLPEEEAIEPSPFDEAVIAAKVERARRIRAAAAEEQLLGDFISLETTTQQYLDEEDIGIIIRQDRGAPRQRRPVRFVDVEEEEGEGGDRLRNRKDISGSSNSEGEEETNLQQRIRQHDDGLDQEAFEEYKQGRIPTKLPNLISPSDADLALEEDEETRAWEMQQIRKGTHTFATPSRAVRRAATVLASDLASKPTIPSPIAGTSLANILSEVEQKFATLQARIDATKMSLNSINLEMAESRIKVAKAQERMAQGQDLVGFLAGMREFTKSLDEMFCDLMPEIEEAEGNLVQLMSQRRTRLFEVAQQEIAVDLAALQKLLLEPNTLYAFISQGTSHTSNLKALLDDARPELADPVAVMARFMDWHQRDNASYEQAYGELSLARILEYFVRIFLLEWDPFVNPSLSFGDRLEPILSSKIKDVLYNEVVLPKVLPILSAGFCPLSSSHANCMTQLLRQLSSILPDKNPSLQETKIILCRVFFDSIQELSEKTSALLPTSMLRSSMILEPLLPDEQLSMQVFQKLSIRFPDQTDTWATLLNYANSSELLAHLRVGSNRIEQGSD